MKAKKLCTVLFAGVLSLFLISTSAFATGTGEIATQVATYEQLAAAMAEGGNILLTEDITANSGNPVNVLVNTTIDLGGNTLTINANAKNETFIYTDAGTTIIKNGTIVVSSDADASVDTGFLNVGSGAILTLESVTLAGSNYKTNYIFDVGHRGESGATLNITNSTLTLENNLYIEDNVVNGSIFYSGTIDNYINITNSTITGKNVGDGGLNGTYTINDSAVAVTGTTKDGVSGMDHGFNGSDLTITDSLVSLSGGVGRGITLGRSGTSNLVVNGNSTLTVCDMTEATIQLRQSTDTLTVAETATVTVDTAISNTVSAITSGTVAVDETVEVTTAVARIGGVPYETLQAAVDAAANGEIVKLLSDISLTNTINLVADDNIILELNGHTITGTDSNTDTGNSSANFYLISVVDGTLTVKDSIGTGKITLVAQNERNWNSESAILHNRGGVLTIESGVFEHLGGTSMAYAIDNSASYHGDAVLNVNGGTIKSTYTAIRMHMSNSSYCGSSIVNITDGYVYGGSRAVWGHVPSDSAGHEGSLSISGGTLDAPAEIGAAINIQRSAYGDVSVLIRDESNAVVSEAEVITGGTFTSDVSAYVVDGYELTQNKDGTYAVKALTWKTATDAGKYVGEDNATYGMMRFLFAVQQTGETIQTVGIRYANVKNITDAILPNVSATVTDTFNGAFYGDVVGLTEESGTVYAKAYVITDKGTYWSDVIDCTLDWTNAKVFADYNPTAEGTDNE